MEFHEQDTMTSDAGQAKKTGAFLCRMTKRTAAPSAGCCAANCRGLPEPILPWKGEGLKFLFCMLFHALEAWMGKERAAAGSGKCTIWIVYSAIAGTYTEEEVKMIEIYLLEQLVAFDRCGTLSAAAEQLHLAQPSLSRSMQKLEGILGVPLFDRQKNRVSSTRPEFWLRNMQEIS